MIQLHKERLAESGNKAPAAAFVLVAQSASFLLADQQPAYALDLTVTNTNDDGVGSLRAAIGAANAASFTGGLGIDLDGDGISANDSGDLDPGPNELQNKPIIGRATTGLAGTIIKGSLNSTPNETFMVEFTPLSPL